MVGISNRFDGLHHFDGIGPMGFCGSSIPAAMAILQLSLLTSDGLVHRHLLPVGCYVKHDQVYHHQFLTLLRLTPTFAHKHHRGRTGVLVTNTAFTEILARPLRACIVIVLCAADSASYWQLRAPPEQRDFARWTDVRFHHRHPHITHGFIARFGFTRLITPSAPSRNI